MKTNSNPIVKAIVRLRMFYADVRGHHGKRWDYEPSNYYMGMKQSKKFKKNDRAVRQDGSAITSKVL
jgi:hypothetical protein|tara:strand:+ start:819 stop:1019 length:201 start_codon:yes stop_codon:yes gene_type:complete